MLCENWLTIINLYFKSKNRVLNENCFHNGLAVHVSKFHALFLKTIREFLPTAKRRFEAAQAGIIE
jgi:hypothetical protein